MSSIVFSFENKQVSHAARSVLLEKCFMVRAFHVMVLPCLHFLSKSDWGMGKISHIGLAMLHPDFHQHVQGLFVFRCPKDMNFLLSGMPSRVKFGNKLIHST
jgi:hypothetical protein